MAVIVNDMGEVKIDAALVASGASLDRTEERLVEMSDRRTAPMTSEKEPRGDPDRRVDRVSPTASLTGVPRTQVDASGSDGTALPVAEADPKRLS